MKDWDDMTDDELSAELAAAVAEESAVSERRREAARAAFTWRTVDEELAELLHDSALDAGAAVRSVDTVRTLAYGTDGMTLELEVHLGSVLGQVIPEGAAAAPLGGGTAKVGLHRPSGPDQSTHADVNGFFRLDAVAPGPVRFTVETGGIRLVTPWVTL